MCGFGGYINFFDNRAIDKSVLERMSDALSHRGPDGSGILCDNNFGMAHRRLKTIGSVDSGYQPATDSTGLVSIVYNGEIYNYLEIKKILEIKGYIFKSDCDTEVLLNSYLEWGTDCLKRFNGIFAFAIFDKRSNAAFLARDHMGVKPLYFCLHNNVFLFASELKSLLASKMTPKHLDYEAFNEYLSLNYTSGARTLIKGIEQLEAGSYLVYSPAGLLKFKYWDIPIDVIRQKKDDSYYEEEFLHLLEDCIQKRLVGDDAKGIFLSGGLDSSALTYFTRKSFPEIRTFSLGFKENAFDDNRIYAKWIADKLGTRHEDMILEAGKIDINTLKKIMWFNDDLVADPTIIPTFFISHFASNSIKIVFAGDGADETLAGYDTYIADRLLSLYQIMPSRIRDYAADNMARKLVVKEKPAGLAFKMKKFLNGAKFPALKAHFYWREVFSEQEKRNLCSPYVFERMNSRDPFSMYNFYYDSIAASSSIEKFLYIDQKVLLSSMLKRMDSMTSAFSMMGRVPFLDYRIVEFCARLPLRLKLKGFTTKYILKKIMKGRIPDRIIYRNKRGFTLPLNKWIKCEWREMIKNVFFSSRLTGRCFNPDYIDNLLKQHCENREDNSWKIFGLLSFYAWAEAHNIDMDDNCV